MLLTQSKFSALFSPPCTQESSFAIVFAADIDEREQVIVVYSIHQLIEGMIHLKLQFLLIQWINLEERHLLAKEAEFKRLHQLAVLSYRGNQRA